MSQAEAESDALTDDGPALVGALPSDEAIIGMTADGPAPGAERIADPQGGPCVDPLEEAGKHAVHHGLSEEHYRFIQKSTRWMRSQTRPRQPRVPVVAEHPDGAVTYRASGSKPVTYFNGFPDFSPYVKKTRDGEPIEAFFVATQNRGRDHTAWKNALAEKGLEPPKKCDFHHGPTSMVDGEIVVLGQALPHYVHKIAHSGGFSVAKAAAGSASKRPRSKPSTRKGRARRSSAGR